MMASDAGASSAPNAPCRRAGGEQQRLGLRGAAEAGGHREADEADEERALAADVVGDAATEQQQAAERERVGRDGPRDVLRRDAEVLGGGRQGDVHDGGVEHDHQLGDRDDAEDQPAATVGGGGGEGRVVEWGIDRFDGREGRFGHSKLRWERRVAASPEERTAWRSEGADPMFLSRAPRQCISRCLRRSRNLSSLGANSLRLLSVPALARACRRSQAANAVGRPNIPCRLG